MKNNNREKVKKRTRFRTDRNRVKPCLKVYRSNLYTYAIILDSNNKILTSFDSRGSKKSKLEAAKEVGSNAGDYITKNKLDNVYFDRNGYRYHGRVKAVADGAREAGVKF